MSITSPQFIGKSVGATDLFVVLLQIAFLSVFFILFTISFQTSPDGEAYLDIFRRLNTFGGREEIGFLAYAWLLNRIFSNPELSMYITIAISLAMYFYSCRLYLTRYDLINVSAVLFSIVTLFSNPLGVQLRIGFASFILVALFSALTNYQVKKGWSALLLAMPILFHYGVAFAALVAVAMAVIPPRHYKRLILLANILVVLFTVTLFSLFVEQNPYYTVYAADEALGRALPITIVTYIFFVLWILIAKRKLGLNSLEWFSLAGIGLVCVFFLNDFYIASKMLLPFLITSFLCVLKYLEQVKFKGRQAVGLILYFLSYFGFFYYASQIHYSI